MKFYKKYLKYIINNKFNKNKLSYSIFFVTSMCDASCENCFYKNSLNKYKDLNLGEIDIISKKLGQFPILLISGGEPFLRKDLDKVIGIFTKNNNVGIINIPTNGLNTKEIIYITEKILKQNRNRNRNISINPSLDGLYDVNDKLRSKNEFNKTIKTIKELEKLKEKYDNLEIVINTVISKDNVTNILSLMSYLRGFNIDSHNFELIRNKKLLPSLRIIKRLHHSILVNREKYLSGFLEKVIVLGSLGYIHSIKENSIRGKSFGCVAITGKSIKVLDSNGQLRKCELLPDNKITKNCTCTHVCFIGPTIASRLITLVKIPYYYTRYKIINAIKWR